MRYRLLAAGFAALLAAPSLALADHRYADGHYAAPPIGGVILDELARGMRHYDDDYDDDFEGRRRFDRLRSDCEPCRHKAARGSLRDGLGEGRRCKRFPHGLARRDDLPPGLRRQYEQYGALPPGLDDRYPGRLDGGPLPWGPAYGYRPYDDRRADAEFIAGATALILDAILLSRRD